MVDIKGIFMKANFDVHRLIKQGKIHSEYELEQAFIAERKLNKLSKEDDSCRELRSQLRQLIANYEKEVWDSSSITDEKVIESDLAEITAEKEQLFFLKRKKMIKSKLKELGLTQEQLGAILGHKSKTYMSELINGLCPFTLNDLLILHQMLQIDLSFLIPNFLSFNERRRINEVVQKIQNSKIKMLEVG